MGHEAAEGDAASQAAALTSRARGGIMRRGKVLAQPEMVRVPIALVFLLPVKPSFA